MDCSKQWLQITACKQRPCSSSATLTESDNSVLLLANGSQYLYCLDTKKGVLLSALKYSSPVVHVSPLFTGCSGTCAVCCLGNGHVVVLPLNAIISRSKLPPGADSLNARDEDIFKTLLSRPDGVTDSSPTPGEQISITIATSPVSDAFLQRAVVIENKLLVFQTSLSSAHHILSIFMPGRVVRFGALTVPSFLDQPLKELVLSPLVCSRSSMSALPSNGSSMSALPANGSFLYKPSILILSCGNPSSETNTRLNPDLFSHLFGPEISLSGSPVVLVGCENGHILYSSLSQIGVDQSPQGLPRDHLPYLYSLGQPVRSLYGVHLPERVTPELELMSALDKPAGSAKDVANVLVFVGCQGKIVLCTSNFPSQRSATFQEYHVPGPITSSLLVEGHALFYTTLSNVYRICLSESCVRAVCASGSKQTAVLIPEEVFRLPEGVCEVDPGTVLLKFLGVEISSSSKVFDLLCVTTSGRVCCHKITTKICGKVCTEEIDSSSLTLDLKQCLATMEVTSEHLNQLSAQTERRDTCLAELSKVLSLFCDLAESSCKGQKVKVAQSCSKQCPFLCKCVPCYEEIGVCAHTPCIDVRLKYGDNQTTPLSCGWALIVQLLTESNRNSREGVLLNSPKVAVSRVVPLAKLKPGGRLSTRIRIVLEPWQPLNCTLRCFLHYDAAHLVRENWEGSCMTTPTTVTLPLCTKSLDAVDYLLPVPPVAREASTSSPLSSLWLTGPHESDCSESLTLQTSSLASVIPTHTLEEDWSELLLCWFLRRQELTKLVTKESAETSIVQLASHSGCVISFKSTHLPSSEEVVLSLQGATGGPSDVVNEFVDCIKRRLA